jgi:ActR/RegA family two-component response regulator/predicted Ser/Thr protein kinase
MSTAQAPAASVPQYAAASRTVRLRGLVVHDDLELRLKLAELAGQASASLGFDTCTRAAFDSLPIDRLRSYAALFLIVDFSFREQSDAAVHSIARLRDQARRLPIVVIARGGDERASVRVMRAGALDYWPAHAVNINELGAILRPLIEAADPGQGAATGGGSAVDARSLGRSGIQVNAESPVPGYNLVKKIAQSSGGAVYLAESAQIPHTIALKIHHLVGAESVTEQERQRFLRECELLATLNHRAIADVFDYGVTAACFYLAMEYFPCGSLRERLKNPLSAADALDYAQQMGEALKVIHAAGIIHRDLKPSNLMLTDHNRLVLIDFGLARIGSASSELTHPNIRLGTPYYMSPEQIDGHDPDSRCDLYSLGVIVFEMLTGVLPYRGQSVAEIVERHRVAPVPRLPGLLAIYQMLIDKLMAKKPQERFATAAEFLEGLNRLRAEDVATATPVAAKGRA